MKNFSDANKLNNLRFLQFPDLKNVEFASKCCGLQSITSSKGDKTKERLMQESCCVGTSWVLWGFYTIQEEQNGRRRERTRGPIACKRLLNTTQYVIPKLTENIVCLDEESYREACPSPTPSSEMDENSLNVTVGKNKKKTKEIPKKAWSSPYLENQMANRPLRPPLPKPIHLEAAGRHLSLHKQPQSNSKRDTASNQRPSTAIGLCGKNQIHSTQQNTRQTLSEPKLEDSTEATPGAGTYPDLQSLNLVATGHALGKARVTIAPEKLAKHPQHLYLQEEGRLKADIPLPSNLAIAPLPVLQGGACSHFPSKRLIQVCSTAPPRPRRGFHKACSRAFQRPVVNVKNAHLL
ncbi:uncharacterized protein C12orf42 homolog isoform X2 [Dipodomys merriami]